MKALKTFVLSGFLALTSLLVAQGASAQSASALANAAPGSAIRTDELNMEGMVYLNGPIGEEGVSVFGPDGRRMGTASFEVEVGNNQELIKSVTLKLSNGTITTVGQSALPMVPMNLEETLVYAQGEIAVTGTGRWGKVTKCICQCLFQFNEDGTVTCIYCSCFFLS